jgi:ligand-binding sensor protein
MEFISNVQPFRINKLTDLINEEILELIQLGFVKQNNTPMTIIEKSGNDYLRIPKREDSQPWTEYCKYLRSFPEGNLICINCDIAKAEQMIATNSTSAHQYVCDAGLVDISIPIVVGGRTIAVFLGGQKLYKNHDKNIKIKTDAIAEIVPNLDSNKLSEYANSVEQLSDEEIIILIKKLL